jgi:hypothetical protein
MHTVKILDRAVRTKSISQKSVRTAMLEFVFEVLLAGFLRPLTTYLGKAVVAIFTLNRATVEEGAAFAIGIATLCTLVAISFFLVFKH